MGFSADDMMKLANQAVERPTLVLIESHNYEGVAWGIGLEANPELERHFACCSLEEAKRLMAFLVTVGMAKGDEG